MSTAYALLEDGGYIIVSTPFHGYWKNLALAVTGKLDNHFMALWEHGHIKFWSKRTLTVLLSSAGFRNITFSYAGRPYPFAKSMFACAQR
jgi:2-polyprenyl-6-hydroxyphenyl methylase/3-demethylubiquinone-9 3-methyltransferase